ncbi:glycosyltransferase family 4 protein [Bifidobacterium oedipodis]|uniref:Spore coat protein n=1 Tax=Bifidobacterium oedipodis TaxID=2675322 RepID=A0A7Y0HUJ1_9BIFI|nr:glycosyltransferase family 4 protein [Bifidobacterium sp. DSM 109957]NMM95237.1 spore coat protein [Bifidobacterium sp. DSM 109957]
MNNRVAVITSGYLPVPNVLGGAVEALDMMMVRENERTADFDFTVFSSWTKEAEKVAQEESLKHTQFRFVKTPTLVRCADRMIYMAAKYLLRKKKLMSYRYIAQRLWYIHKVAKTLAHGDANGNAPFDKVMIENHATLFMTMQKHGNAERYAGKVYYHLHNEVLNDFGCKKEISQVRRVLGVSNYILETLDSFLRSHGEPGLRDDQKAVWRNGVDASRFGTAEAAQQGRLFRKQWGIPEDAIVFLFSGRLTEEKGAEQLLQAFKQVAAKETNVWLVIAGAFFFNSSIASPFEQRLHQLADDPTVKNRIVFTGFVNYEDMPAVYAMSDICVLPSIWDDPAPLAVIESLVSGKPLITTRSGGIPEYADDECAIVLDQDENLVSNLVETMMLLADSPERRQAMSLHEAVVAPSMSEHSFMLRLRELLG